MSYLRKKSQIVNGYFEDILPYIEYEKSSENTLIYTCKTKVGVINAVNMDKISKYISINIYDDDKYMIDVSDSSISDIYHGFTSLHNTLLKSA